MSIAPRHRGGVTLFNDFIHAFLMQVFLLFLVIFVHVVLVIVKTLVEYG